jgi:YhcG PDDEXK nuclease domain
MHPEALSIFGDAYTVEFLGLPPTHAEADLHRGLLDKLKDFLIELGRDFCFVGSEYPVQVGGRDFALDLLFFHRGLNCLVAIELKVRPVQRPHAEWPQGQVFVGGMLCLGASGAVIAYMRAEPPPIPERTTWPPALRLFGKKVNGTIVGDNLFYYVMKATHSGRTGRGRQHSRP